MIRTVVIRLSLLFLSAGLAAHPAEAATTVGLPPLDGRSFVSVSSRATNEALAIVYSGDGGWWGDLDRQIAEKLGQRGYGVIGVDTSVYFAVTRRPDTIARDLDALIRGYAEAWKAERVILIGYSFGADIMPMTYNRLSATAKAKVSLMVLLAPGFTAPLRVTLAERTGLDERGPLVEPELRPLPKAKVLCIYGRQEVHETGCLLPELAASEIKVTAGSHHFDGNAEELVEKIVDGDARRRVRSR